MLSVRPAVPRTPRSDRLATGQLGPAPDVSRCVGAAGGAPLDTAQFRLQLAEIAQRQFRGAATAPATLQALLPDGLAAPDGPRLFDPKRRRRRA